MSDGPPRYSDLRAEFDQHYQARESGQPCGCLVCKATNTLGSDTMSETQIPGVAHFPVVAASIDQPDTLAQAAVDVPRQPEPVAVPDPAPTTVVEGDVNIVAGGGEIPASPPVDHAAGDQADDAPAAEGSDSE